MKEGPSPVKIFDAGYREGQNDAFRGLAQEKPPSFWVAPARTIFVVWLVLFSLFGSWDHYRQKLATYRAISIAEGILDRVRYAVTMRRLKLEGEVREIILSLEARADGR